MKRILIILAMLFAINTNAQWQPDVRLTNNPSTSYTSYNNAWCIASSGSDVHVVWQDGRELLYGQIYYKRSTDAGVSWGADTRLVNSPYNSFAPSVTVSGSVVHVVWSEERNGIYEIFYKHSTNSGVNWDADTRLTNSDLDSWNPSIALSGLNVHIVWQDYRDGNWEIYYKHSTDAGVNWGVDTRLSNNVTDSWLPSVAVSGSVVHVIWRDYFDGKYQIYYKRTSDNGLTWEANTRLTINTAYSWNPSIAVSGMFVNVVWHDDRNGNYEIYYKRSTDSGVSWGIDTRLTNDTSDSYGASVAVSGSNIQVVWNDERNQNFEIYYKRSTDAGVSWGVDTRLTNSSAVSGSPSVAVSGSVVHVVWVDNRDGNYEIYYKQDPTGNPTAIQNISTETPSKYSLSQNYPNPFNPITNVKFSIVNVGDVKLVVYDIQGREVLTLVNESLKPGTYEAAFDGSALNSGVYFYKLMTDGFSETKKMLLIK